MMSSRTGRMGAIDHFKRSADSVESGLLVADTVLGDVIGQFTYATTRAAAGRSTLLTLTSRDALAGELRGAARAILTAISK